MGKVVELHIIDFSDARGIKRCELPDGYGGTVKLFSGLLHLICQHHDQPLTDGPIHFLNPTNGRWYGTNDILSEQDDIDSALIAVTDAVKAEFGDATSLYKAVLAIREGLDETKQLKFIQQMAEDIVAISQTLDEALERPKDLIMLKPNIVGIGIDLNELLDRINRSWKKS